jgi:hypothetical protein
MGEAAGGRGATLCSAAPCTVTARWPPLRLLLRGISLVLFCCTVFHSCLRKSTAQPLVAGLCPKQARRRLLPTVNLAGTQQKCFKEMLCSWESQPARVGLSLSIARPEALQMGDVCRAGTRTWLKTLVSVSVVLLCACSAAAAPGGAPTFRASARAAAVLRLPNGSKPKSFAFGNGTDLFVCTLAGEVLHLDTRAAAAAAASGAGGTGAGGPPAAVLAREPGIALAGIAYDPQQHALFVAGTVSGRAYVYFLSGPAPPYAVERRAALPLARVRGWQAPYVNDVLLGPSSAYFTDSFAPLVHVIPRRRSALLAAVAAAAAGDGPGDGVGFFRLGPGFKSSVGRLNANGLVFVPGHEGSKLLVSNFDQSYVARVDLPAPGGAAGGDAAAAVVARLPPLAEGGFGPWPAVSADCMVFGEAPGVFYLSDNFQDR